MKSNFGKFMAAKRQKGFTIIELLIVVAVIGVIALGANAGLNLRNDRVGSNEGNIINYALQCAQTKNSSVSYGSVTVASLSNLGCFPDEIISNKGLATATATSGLVGAAYTVASVNINGTNDGLAVSLAGVPNKNCAGLVKAVSAASTIVNVTPAAGTLSQVKAVGGVLQDSAVGLACNSGATSTVQAQIGKS